MVVTFSYYNCNLFILQFQILFETCGRRKTIDESKYVKNVPSAQQKKTLPVSLRQEQGDVLQLLNSKNVKYRIEILKDVPHGFFTPLMFQDI